MPFSYYGTFTWVTSNLFFNIAVRNFSEGNGTYLADDSADCRRLTDSGKVTYINYAAKIYF